MGKKKGSSKKAQQEVVVLSLDDIQAPIAQLPTAPSLPSGPSGDGRGGGGKGSKADAEGGWGRNSEIRGRDGGRYRDTDNLREKFNAPSMADSASDWRRGGGGGFSRDALDSQNGDNIDWKRGEQMGPGGGASDFDNDWRSNPKELPPAPNRSGVGNNRRFGQDHQMGRDKDEDNIDWTKRATMPLPPSDKVQRSGNQGQRHRYLQNQNQSEEEHDWKAGQNLPPGNENKSSDTNPNFHKRMNSNMSFGDKMGSSDEVSQWRGSGQQVPPPPSKSDEVNNWRSNGPRDNNFGKPDSRYSRYNKNKEGGNWRSRHKDLPGNGNEEEDWHRNKKGNNRFVKESYNKESDENARSLNVNPNSPKSTESVSTTSTSSMSEAPPTPQPTPEPLNSKEKEEVVNQKPPSVDLEKKSNYTSDETQTIPIKEDDKEKENVITEPVKEELPKALSAKEEKALAKKKEKERKKQEEEEKKAREAEELAAKLEEYEAQKEKISKLFSLGLKGSALSEAFKGLKAEFQEEPVVKNNLIIEYLLKFVLDESSVSNCEWMEETAYGTLLSALLQNDVEKLKCVFEIQKYCHSLNFPRLPTNIPLITQLFKTLYEKNLIDGDVFIFLWKENEREDDGKRKALIQTTQWLLEVEEELEQLDEEED